MTQPILQPDDFAFADDADILQAVRACHLELYNRAVKVANARGVTYGGKAWPDLTNHKRVLVQKGYEAIVDALLAADSKPTEAAPARPAETVHPQDTPEATLQALGAKTEAVARPDATLATEAQRSAIMAMANKLGISHVNALPPLTPLAQLTKTQASEVLDSLRAKLLESQAAPSPDAPVGKSLFISLINAAKDKGLAVDDASREARLEATNEVLTHSGLPMVTSWKQLNVPQYNALYTAIAEGHVSWDVASMDAALPVNTREEELVTGGTGGRI